MKMEALIETLDNLVRPIAEELGYEIYHIEYVKENGEYYLRFYIDKDGGIKLSDCEALSRRISDLMDEKDPIKEAYYLEVSSPGLNRSLHTLEHFNKFINRDVFIRFNKTLNGSKNIKGILKEASSDEIKVLVDEEEIVIPIEKIKTANLDGEI